MASIRRLGTSKWSVNVYCGVGASGKVRRVVKRFFSLREARAFAAQATLQQRSGVGLPDEHVRLGEYLQTWLDHRKPIPGSPEASRLAMTTWIRYESLIKLHVIPALGHLRLSRLTPSALEAHYRALRETKTLSGATCLFVHRVLGKALQDAVRKGLLSRNPGDRAYLDAPRKGSYSPTVLDAEQLKLFLACARRTSPNFGLWALACTSGLRQGELLGLRWADVDLMLGEVHVTQKMYRLSHDKTTTLVFDKPKSANGTRTIPVVPLVIEELRRLKDVQLLNQTKFGERIDGTWTSSSANQTVNPTMSAT